MHETHMIQPIIDGIAEHARKEGGKKITNLKLKIGMLTGVREDSFRETFKVLAKGTMLENTKLEITFFPGTRVDVVSFDME